MRDDVRACEPPRLLKGREGAFNHPCIRADDAASRIALRKDARCARFVSVFAVPIVKEEVVPVANLEFGGESDELRCSTADRWKEAKQENASTYLPIQDAFHKHGHMSVTPDHW
jgi:hypothetical protein